MPIYEFQCPVHSTFEQIHSMKSIPKAVKCIFVDEDYQPCKLPAKIQVSAPTMRPDPHWNGTVTHTGKTVFSRSEYEEDNKYLVPATEAAVNHVQKKKIEVVKELHQKHEQKVENFLGNQLAGVEISNDGYSIKQRDKFNRMRRSD